MREFYVRIDERDLAGPALGIGELVFSVERMTWKATGGPDEARLKVTGPEAQIWNLLLCLRCPIIIGDRSDDAVWWGYINEATVNQGAVSVGASLEKMANKVRCIYSEVNTAGTVGERAETTWITDAASITEYGTKQAVVNLPEATTVQADARAAVVLEARKAPVGTIRFGKFTAAATAVIVCRGWWQSLGWSYYENLTGKEGYDEAGDGLQAFGDAASRTKVAQSFQLASAADWAADTVRLRVRKEKTPTDNVTVNLCSDSGGNPGTSLANGSIAGADIDEDLNWSEFQLNTRVTLAVGTTYWVTVERSGGLSGTNFYKVDGNEDLGYVRGSLKIYNGSGWVARSPDADLLFEVAGSVETSTQIGTILDDVTAGQFIGAGLVDVDSGIFSSPYREGDRTALACAEELLQSATTSDLRMLISIDSARRYRVYQEPAKYDQDYLLDKTGKLYDNIGQEVDKAKHPVGVWVKLRDITPATVNLSDLSGLQAIFVEEVTYEAKDDRAQVRERDALKLLELE